MIKMKEPLAAPVVPRDCAFFYAGLNEHRLLVQKCDNCAKRRHPPGPMCPHCQSLAWSAEQVSGTGVVHSFIVHHYPVFPDYESPNAVVLVQLEPDIRMVGAFSGAETAAIEIGMRVEADFVEHAEGFNFHYFKPEGC